MPLPRRKTAAERGADYLRSEAEYHRQRAQAMVDRARMLEREAGLREPCGLCGRRECGH